MKNFPSSAEINYLAESEYGNEIIIKTSAERMNGTLYNHSVFRTDDYKELCRIRIEWKEVNIT